MTTEEDIKRWFEMGKEKCATHMLVVCDTFDWDDYPVYVQPGEDVYKIAAANSGPNMTKLMEVYNYKLTFEQQRSAGRVFNY